MDDFYHQLFGHFDAILNTLRPKRYMMFALDGPGPCAKLAEQQQRRKVGFHEQISKLECSFQYGLVSGCIVLEKHIGSCFFTHLN